MVGKPMYIISVLNLISGMLGKKYAPREERVFVSVCDHFRIIDDVILYPP